MPPLGRSPSEYCHNVWYGKTWVGLPDGEKFENILVSTQYTNVTGERTDTAWRHRLRYAWSRAEKICDIYLEFWEIINIP